MRRRPRNGHAAFLGATPAPGARVETAPAAITLRFTDTLNRRLSEAHLVDVRSGRRVPAAQHAAGSDGLVLRPVTALARGAYRVEWHTVSTTDGHELQGSFGFGLRVAAAGGGRAVEQSPLADLGWVRALVRGLLYATLLSFAGALLLAALLGRDWLVPEPLEAAAARAGLDAAAARRRARSLVADLGLFAAALAAAAALVDAGRAARGVSPAELSDFLLANLTGLARVAVVALVALAALLARRRPPLAALAVTGALGALVASGHANSAPVRGVAIVADWTHLLGAAVWIGGIALIALAWAPALRHGTEARLTVARHVLAPFGRVALPAFCVVVVAGVVNAAVELGAPSDLWQTAYGRVLLVKVALVGAIAAASYGHAQRLRPRLLAANPHPPAALERRHWRLVGAEPLLALGVFAAVGVLVAFPLPPRQLEDATSGSRAAVPPCSPCPLPAPAADELSVAAQGGSTVVATWIRRSAGGTSGTVRLLDYRGNPATGPARVAGARQTGCGPGCVRFAAAGTPGVLHVTVLEHGRTFAVALPATWSANGATRARALLDRAQATMRDTPQHSPGRGRHQRPGHVRTDDLPPARARSARLHDRPRGAGSDRRRPAVRTRPGRHVAGVADGRRRGLSDGVLVPLHSVCDRGAAAGRAHGRRPADRGARVDGPGDAGVDANDGRRGDRARAARRARAAGALRHAPQCRLRRAGLDRPAEGSRPWRLRHPSARRCASPGESPPR